MFKSFKTKAYSSPTFPSFEQFLIAVSKSRPTLSSVIKLVKKLDSTSNKVDSTRKKVEVKVANQKAKIEPAPKKIEKANPPKQKSKESNKTNNKSLNNTKVVPRALLPKKPASNNN